MGFARFVLRQKLFCAVVLIALALILGVKNEPRVRAEPVGNPSVANRAAIPRQFQRVLIISVDGLRQADLADPALTPFMPNILALAKTGISYSNAYSSPSDSFPGLIGVVTGGSPKTTGIYYDVSYSRTLFPQGSGTAGAFVDMTENNDINFTFLGGATGGTTGFDATALNTTTLPSKTAFGATIKPHDYLKVNTIFEVAHAAGMRTAYTDKHCAYEIVNGPSGTGCDDFAFVEVDSQPTLGTLPADLVNSNIPLIDNGTGLNAKVEFTGNTAMGIDDLRVQQVINQINGKNSKGTASAPVPNLFGFNMNAYSAAEKFNKIGPDRTTGGVGITTNGNNNVEIISATITKVLAHTDASVGKVVTALKNAGLLNSTLIILNAKHGQTPRIGPTRFTDDASPPWSTLFTNPEFAQGTAADTQAMLWLTPGANAGTAAGHIQTAVNAANAMFPPNGIVLSTQNQSQIPSLPGFGNPLTDDRAPDFFVQLQPDAIYATPTGKKLSEHGGLSEFETHIGLIVSSPGLPAALQGTVNDALVSNHQIAPTALLALGLEPNLLQAVTAEGTRQLPGLFDGPPIITVTPTATPNPAAPGQTVAFNLAASSTATLTFTWNFGDPTSASNTATGTSPTHAYASAGFYTATVQVTDGTNLPISASVMVRVVPTGPGSLDTIKNFIIIYQENWSFDSLYSQFPGANGIKFGTPVAQIDPVGTPLTTVLQPINNNPSPEVFDAQFATFNKAVSFYDMSPFVGGTGISGDIKHRFYTEQAQIHGGKMDKFVTLSDNPGLVLSALDATPMPEGVLAQQYVMCDNFFHAAFGGSFLNHQWLVAGASPVFNLQQATNAGLLQPTTATSLNFSLNGNIGFDANGNPFKSTGEAFGTLGEAATVDNQVTPDGYAVNTLFTVFSPHPAGTNPLRLVPALTNPHIGDRLDGAGVSWAWYSGGWDNALAGTPDPLFQFHHQPFAFFANLGDGTPGKAAHLKDENKFFSDLANNTLPAVSFIKPLGQNNEHPGYATELAGQQHVAALVTAIQQSAYWKNCAIIITYDENGGRWDHVAPPSAANGAKAGTFDRWGPGTRVPAIIISPYAKKKFVDHTAYDTTSILRTIEKRFNLAPLGTRDAAVASLDNSFDFTQVVNTSPVITGTINAGSPIAGTPATLTINASSPVSLPLNYTWVFGDNTPTATGSPVTHTFAAAGNYNVSVTVSDNVNPPVVVSGSVTVAPPPQPLTVTGVSVKLGKTTGTDSITISGTLPSSTASATTSTITIGGITPFTLTPNAKGKNASLTIGKAGKGTTVKYSFKAKGDFKKGLAFPTTGGKVTVSLPISIVLNAVNYNKTASLAFDTKSGSGKGK